mmetsp:Transcript_3207/g.5857  ORF Transcript_3207/g.5857 Transcript_3207/m.5857 type:complete len:217 (+) Transcript_3207:2115-2765(+)
MPAVASRLLSPVHYRRSMNRWSNHLPLKMGHFRLHCYRHSKIQPPTETCRCRRNHHRAAPIRQRSVRFGRLPCVQRFCWRLHVVAMSKFVFRRNCFWAESVLSPPSWRVSLQASSFEQVASSSCRMTSSYPRTSSFGQVSSPRPRRSSPSMPWLSSSLFLSHPHRCHFRQRYQVFCHAYSRCHLPGQRLVPDVTELPSFGLNRHRNTLDGWEACQS